jgi:hypothetical protein
MVYLFFLWVYGDSARRVIQILKKISLIVFALSSSWQDRFRNGIEVVLDAEGFYRLDDDEGFV